MAKFMKKCPSCNRDQEYSSWDSLRNALRKQSTCQLCCASKKRTRPSSDNWKRECPSCHTEIRYKSVKSYLLCIRQNTNCRRCAMIKSSQCIDKSYFQSDEYRQKMSSIITMKRKTDSYGEEFKKKCRENKLCQIRFQGTKYTYNPRACTFMNFVNNKFGWNLQHAENGGEIIVSGYSLDGYDKSKNIVFEYDEPKHRVASVREKDKKRQERIIREMNPLEFWRYDERDKKLTEIISNKEVICPLP